MDKIILSVILVVSFSFCNGTTFRYLQEYVVGDPIKDGSYIYDVDVASKIEGNVILVPCKN